MSINPLLGYYFKWAIKVPDMISNLISAELALAKASTSPLIFAPFLGLTIDVALHLKPRQCQPVTVGEDILRPLKACSLFLLFLVQS